MGYAEGLAAELLRVAEKNRMLAKGDRVLVAFSGGADSTALLLLLTQLAPKLEIEVCAAHLNHGLRGEESDRDERFVREFCGVRGILLETAYQNVKEAAKAEGAGIEETARLLRYRFLQGAAERLGCTKIATAHNANDNAETILLNLVRGSGLRGLCGIPPVRGNIIRPILGVTRESIEAYLADQKTGYVTDHTNSDITYTRNKIRHQVIPLFNEINPSLLGGLCDTSELLRADADYLDEISREVPLLSENPPTVRRQELLKLPAAISGRVLRRMYSIAANVGIARRAPENVSRYKELSKVHVDSVLHLAASENSSGKVSLPGGVAAKRRYEDVILVCGSSASVPGEVKLTVGEIRFGRWRIRTERIEEAAGDRTDGAVYLRPELLEKGLSIRSRHSGDSLSPVTRSWTKSLKKLYIEMRIPADEREGRPVIACGESVCAVPGWASDRKFAVHAGPALKITFSEYADQNE